MRSETKGYALTFLSAACLGSTGILARFAYRFEPDPLTLAFGAILVLVGIGLVRRP